MKILFLDVDGVLNRCGASGHGLESDKISILKTIIDATGCEIVLSSTWRKSKEQRQRLHKVLESDGIKWNGDRTPVFERKVGFLWEADGRGKEIQSWLTDNAPNATFVILDDASDMGALLPHLVRTYSFEGLTRPIADEVIQRLNSQ